MRRGIPLMVAGFLGLFYELVFIRWLQGNVTSLAYFANLVLISSFFGLGLGYLLPATRRDLFPFFPPLLLSVVAVVILGRDLGVLTPAGSAEWIWSGYAANALKAAPFKLPLLAALVLVFLLNALVFVPLGQKTRRLLEAHSPLAGYTWNIAGGLAGIAVFSALSASYPCAGLPTSWFAIGGALCVGLMDSARSRLAAVAATLALCGLVQGSARDEIWSPYYVIQTAPRPPSSVALYVNKFLHQEIVDFDRDPRAAEKYGLLYSAPAASGAGAAARAEAAPQRVLVLGAGTGNDVAMALRGAVREVDAVEIDPEIVALGRRLHPQRPYSDPRVRVVVDDARSFLRRTRAVYDLIVLGTLDSHALLSSLSTVRLDNSIYTRESMEDLRRHLAPRGVVALVFSVPHGWLGLRLVRMVSAAFPHTTHMCCPADPYHLFNLLIVAGPGAPAWVAADPARAAAFTPVPSAAPSRDLPSDDWPYLYLDGRGIPGHYLATLAVLMALCAAIVWRLAPRPSRAFAPAFLFSGMAFLLLEATAVTALSLLFGSTWRVNAFVFAAILVMVLLANLAVARGRFADPRWIAAGLFAALGLNFALPPRLFLEGAAFVRWVLPTLLAATPIFFGSVLFARLLARARDIRVVYASNLLGCVLGGFVEYASMAAGFRFLFVLAALCYVPVLTAGRGAFGEAAPGTAPRP
jgi:spermidine synthase